MRVCAIATAGEGTNNQMRGIILEASKGESVPVTRQALLRDADGTILYPSNFSNERDFEAAIAKSVKQYLAENEAAEMVLLPCSYSGEEDNKNIDLLSKYVKAAFEAQGHHVQTMVVASNLYPYQYVDKIHVGKHLLSAEDEKKLKSDPILRAKVIETLGVPSNISRTSVNTAANSEKLKPIIDEYRDRKASGRKLAVFSLGGKTADENIKFTIADAKKLMTSAALMKMRGYDIVFTNSPRTPNDVTDYLIEHCGSHGFAFYNSKQIAQTEEDKKNFRMYDGPHKDLLAKQWQEVGNIYPAILGVCDLGIYTHDSFSYTSDSAALGIPTAVYTGNTITDKRPDCAKLFEISHQGGYVLDLDEAVSMIQNRKAPTTRPMSNVTSQVVTAMAESGNNESLFPLHLGNMADRKDRA